MNKKTFLWFFTFLYFIPAFLNGFTINGLNFYISDEFLFNRNNTADKPNQFYEEFSIFANYKKWSSNFTLRINNFYKQSPNETLPNNNFDLFRKSVHYKSKVLSVTFGDFYSLLGRGLVLSVLKNSDILRERTIFGGIADLNLKRFDVKGLGGIIKDETNSQSWNLAGGEFKYRFYKKNIAGFHFSRIDDIDTFRNLGERFTYSFSIQGSEFLKYFSYYTEIAFLDFTENSSKRGKAVYSNITFNRGHFTISAEYKSYENFNNEMNNPPIADRADEVSTITDSNGGRILFSYTFFDPDISLFFNIGSYREYTEKGTHIFAGINSQDLWDRLTFSISYGVKNIIFPVKKFSADMIYQFSDTLSMEVSSKDKRYRDGNFFFNEKDNSIQISVYPFVSLTFLFQYSYNKIMGLNDFFSSSLTLYFKNNLEISVTGGNIRGGQICSGGQCFIMPPFKGFKLSVLKIFK